MKDSSKKLIRWLKRLSHDKLLEWTIDTFTQNQSLIDNEHKKCVEENIELRAKNIKLQQIVDSRDDSGIPSDYQYLKDQNTILQDKIWAAEDLLSDYKYRGGCSYDENRPI